MQENEKKEPCCCCAHKTKHRSEEEYKSLVHRLNRIEGQIRGIRGMVENEAYCPDILVQSAAVTAAMNAFNRELLANHIRTCVADDIRAGNDEVVDELLKTQPKLGKLMYHELVTMCCSSAVFARMNGSPEAEKQLYELLDHMQVAGPVGRRLRSRSLASFLCVPGRFGRALCVNGYRLARRVVSFN